MFDLGRWLTPMAAVGAVWAGVVIVVLTVPSANNTTAYITAGALAFGALWWLLVLRHRLNAGTAGPPDVISARANRS